MQDKKTYANLWEKPIRIGTRGSKLALWQAKFIAEKIEAQGVPTEIITIETKGDKILNKSLAKIGSKGIFTAEIEDKLRDGSIDIAVHSAKDVQADLAEDLKIIAFSERENPADVVVSFNKNTKLTHFDNSFIVGTSSTRRVALLRHMYPNIRTADARGNLTTRMKKLEEGYYDALILAYAGVLRMNYHEYIVQYLDINTFVPAVGQGAILVEASCELNEAQAQQLRQWLNHEPTEWCITAERAFLKEFQGGCSVPVFGYAKLENETLTLTAGVVSLDGQRIVKQTAQAHYLQAERLGIEVAQQVIAHGGREVIQSLKKHTS
ncbi:MAG: hydroxymethylbilane synthase [Microscillaceae bacterium]|nr:hydroxymethylbilane synthase [Microscillaceae bacterium]MDW8461529.1 hydroxymethylbilane synthase [Cytophagales bacterium]